MVTLWTPQEAKAAAASSSRGMGERPEFSTLISSGTDFLHAAGEVFASLSLSKTKNTTSTPCLRHSKDKLSGRTIHCLSTKHHVQHVQSCLSVQENLGLCWSQWTPRAGGNTSDKSWWHSEKFLKEAKGKCCFVPFFINGFQDHSAHEIYSN